LILRFTIFSIAFIHLFVYVHCMKKKQFKSKGKEVVAVAQSPAASLSDKSAKGKQPAASPPGDVVTHLEFPPPHFLLEQAEKEPNRKLLGDYLETITVLRKEKGFSFREIAEWLTQNGVTADYNAVYRVYTKGMPDDEVAALDQEPADS
jgi:hypothetical protein